ncbi:MAG TPA: glycosyltransferase [Solirubrobacteraceae bacterium]|jgi:GT2 family glycosyltransferase|nr:glycosyltransferase [Solirubrobacteraceae bacterium]
MELTPTATIVVPTLGRPDYLDVALASIAGQARELGAELLVIEDGPPGSCLAIAARHGAGYHALGSRRGLNVARNAGLRAAGSELIVYVDDDVEAAPGWLRALLEAADAQPEVGVFTGPIHARLEGRGLRTCGREGAPITELELGGDDLDAPHAWGANMTIRRSAFVAIGEFDEDRSGAGDEEVWQRAHLAAGGRIRYIAGAAVWHRRAAVDATVRALARGAFRRGAQARRLDQEDGVEPSLAGELRVLAGCLWHAVNRRCENGLVMAAHTAGRLRAGLARPVDQDRGGSIHRDTLDRSDRADDFLSGESGTVGGRRDLLRGAADLLLDAQLLLGRLLDGQLRPGRLLDGQTPLTRLRDGRRPPSRTPANPDATRDDRPVRRRVLVLTVARPDHRDAVRRAATELHGSAHDVTIDTCPPGENGKFENVNALLTGHRLADYDWLIVADDDIELPRGFLDRFLGLAENFDLRLAQPAHRIRSHAAWRLTRRRPGSIVRETRFVEIGPLTLLHPDTFDTLLPFPDLRMGWGLDAHWAALAADRGWRLGIVDATPIAHRARPAGDAYSREQALTEARAFLADHAYLPAAESQRTLVVHRRCA